MSHKKKDSYAWWLFKDTWRSYNAPLVGAIRGAIRAIKAEQRLLDNEMERFRRR